MPTTKGDFMAIQFNFGLKSTGYRHDSKIQFCPVCIKLTWYHRDFACLEAKSAPDVSFLPPKSPRTRVPYFLIQGGRNAI